MVIKRFAHIVFRFFFFLRLFLVLRMHSFCWSESLHLLVFQGIYWLEILANKFVSQA